MYNHIVAFFYRLAYYIVRFAFFFYYDIQFEGRENAPPKTESAIFASNHRSYLDPVLVAMGAPHPFNYIAKEELFKHKVFARFISQILLRKCRLLELKIKPTGMTGFPLLAASTQTPLFPLPTFPSVWRVPSGKIVR